MVYTNVDTPSIYVLTSESLARSTFPCQKFRTKKSGRCKVPEPIPPEKTPLQNY